jgi:hypothetical protein
MIEGSVLQAQSDPAIDTAASTIPKGRTLDLALVLLVQHEASVAGYPARGAGESDVVDGPV